MNVFTKWKQTQRLREPAYGYQEGRMGEGIVRDGYVHTAIFKMDNQ